MICDTKESASGPFDVGRVLVVRAIAIPNLVKSKWRRMKAPQWGVCDGSDGARLPTLRRIRCALLRDLATLGPNPDGSMKENATTREPD